MATPTEALESVMPATRELVLDLHRRMVRIRRFEERAGKLVESGDMPGFLHLYGSDFLKVYHNNNKEIRIFCVQNMVALFDPYKNLHLFYILDIHIFYLFEQFVDIHIHLLFYL